MIVLVKFITFLFIFVIGFLMYEMVINKQSINKLLNISNYKNALITGIIVILAILIINNLIDNFKIVERFAPTDYSMGDFSNLKLKPDSCSEWRKAPACNKLYEKVFTPQGTQIPLKPNFTKSVSEGPPVDGNTTDDNRKDMFIFAYNKSSPECCPSTYSTSNGCICTTKNQREYINQRGNNRSYPKINKNLKETKFIVNNSNGEF